MADRDLERRYLAMAAGVALLVVVLLPVQPLHAVAGLALALYLPGRALLTGVSTVPIRRSEEVALASGLSLCVTVLSGFALHYLDRMTSAGWATMLAAFTIGMCLVGHLARIEPAVGRREIAFWRLLRRRDRAALVTAGFFCLLSFTIASAGLQRYPFFTYTELWLASDPKGRNAAINLGVRNREGAGQSFVIELHTDSQMLARWAGVHLDPDETWTKAVPWSMATPTAGRLEARLYKAEAPAMLYRRVWLSRFK